MSRKVLILSALLLQYIISWSQTFLPQSSPPTTATSAPSIGSDEFQCWEVSVYERLSNDTRIRYDQFIADFIASRQNVIISASSLGTSLLTSFAVFPIVFHVLYDTDVPTQNIGDDILAYQMHIITQDFCATNPDYDDTPAEFQPLRAGDMRLAFYNDQIIRQSKPDTLIDVDLIKTDPQGSAPVLADRKMNWYWIRNLIAPVGFGGGGLNGWGTWPFWFPDNPERDGIAVTFRSILPISNQGRTGTHEVGHWLALFHTWDLEGSCDTNGDACPDTPPQLNSNRGDQCTNPRAKTCPVLNTFSRELFENYMDYTIDDCASMFTQDQRDLIYSSIQQWRPNFMRSNIGTAIRTYINWVYFRQFPVEQTSASAQCYDTISIPIYTGDLNENSPAFASFIYGCKQETLATNVRHISDVMFIYGLGSVCPFGWEKASQNLNNGNSMAIFMCYLRKETRLPDNCAIVDMTFVRDGDKTGLDPNEWFTFDDNINPEGVSLQLAIKREEILVGGVPCPTPRPTQNPTKSPTAVCDKGCSPATIGKPCIHRAPGNRICHDYMVTGSCPQGTADCEVPGSSTNPCLLCQPNYPCTHNNDGSCTPMLPNSQCATGTTLCPGITPSPMAPSMGTTICSKGCSPATLGKPCIHMTPGDNTCWDYMSVGGCPPGTMDCDAVGLTILQDKCLNHCTTSLPCSHNNDNTCVTAIFGSCPAGTTECPNFFPAKMKPKSLNDHVTYGLHTNKAVFGSTLIIICVTSFIAGILCLFGVLCIIYAIGSNKKRSKKGFTPIDINDSEVTTDVVQSI